MNENKLPPSASPVFVIGLIVLLGLVHLGIYAFVQGGVPQVQAAEALELLSDTAVWNAASAAGIKRVEANYTQEKMFASYRAIYEEVMKWQA
jgi:glycosyltransferase involved in cell wall biosynthesis